jgi:hypothetical protein
MPLLYGMYAKSHVCEELARTVHGTGINGHVLQLAWKRLLSEDINNSPKPRSSIVREENNGYLHGVSSTCSPVYARA